VSAVADTIIVPSTSPLGLAYVSGLQVRGISRVSYRVATAWFESLVRAARLQRASIVGAAPTSDLTNGNKLCREPCTNATLVVCLM